MTRTYNLSGDDIKKAIEHYARTMLHAEGVLIVEIRHQEIDVRGGTTYSAAVTEQWPPKPKESTKCRCTNIACCTGCKNSPRIDGYCEGCYRNHLPRDAAE